MVTGRRLGGWRQRTFRYKRGEPRVCSMVVPPNPAEEDRRRIARERRTLIKERIEHINRVKGLLASRDHRLPTYAAWLS
jgi:transposase